MSIRLKITLSILLVVSIFMAGFSVLILKREYESGLASARQGVQTQASLLESAITTALLTFDYATVDEAAARLVESPNVASVSVYSIQGDVIARHGALAEIGAYEFDGFMRLLAGDRLAGGQVTREVVGPTGAVGWFIISADFEALQTRINKDALLSLELVLLGCFFVGATSWWVCAMVGRRIERLTDGARQIADGKLCYRLRVSGTDEVAKIGQAIDSMADALTEGRCEAERQARTDALTGLMNRTGLVEVLETTNWSGRSLTALHIDLDRFKLINDTRGHAAGDALLKTVGHRLHSILPHAVALARNGGDEFIVLLDVDPHSDSARQTAETILDAIRHPILYGDITLRIGASVGAAGLSTVPDDPDVLEKVIADADIALYQAKTGGRGKYAVFDEAARIAREAEADLEWEIAEALKASTFVPFVQPQVDCATGQIVGAEILARWQHPAKGLLSPGGFLEGLRNAELAEAIDEQVRAKALEWMAQPDQDRPGTVSVNLTPAHLTRVGAAGSFSDTITKIGLRPDRVIVEVHEDVILDADGVVQENLNTLIKRGHALELDDFGTGSASLEPLMQMALDTLKIDRSFVIDIDTDVNRQSIVAAIIGMARALGVRVLAEGVETEAERATLVALGCSVMQGYFFARPMSLDDYPAWANTWRTRFDTAAA